MPSSKRSSRSQLLRIEWRCRWQSGVMILVSFPQWQSLFLRKGDLNSIFYTIKGKVKTVLFYKFNFQKMQIENWNGQDTGFMKSLNWLLYQRPPFDRKFIHKVRPKWHFNMLFQHRAKSDTTTRVEQIEMLVNCQMSSFVQCATSPSHLHPTMLTNTPVLKLVNVTLSICLAMIRTNKQRSNTKEGMLKSLPVMSSSQLAILPKRRF